MIHLRIVPAADPNLGFRAEVGPKYWLLSQWLEADLDEEEAVSVWREIGRCIRGDIPEFKKTFNQCALIVKDNLATLDAPLVTKKYLDMPLRDLVDATERWFDVVSPSVAAQLREISKEWHEGGKDA
jgi:hypothetical protein